MAKYKVMKVGRRVDRVPMVEEAEELAR